VVAAGDQDGFDATRRFLAGMGFEARALEGCGISLFFT